MSGNRVLLIVLVALAAVAAGVLLIFVFASAAFPVIVPNVVKTPSVQAGTTLERAGLALGAVTRVATGSVGPGLVVSQSPAADSSVRRGTAVALAVAVEQAFVAVPDVVALEETAAVKTLTAAMFPPLVVDVFDTAGTPVGSVVDQMPAPKTLWLTGKSVAIAVVRESDAASGAVTVPEFTGKTLAQAKAAVGATGLTLSGFYADIESPVPNAVVDQVPSAGLRVARGTRVLLMFRAPGQ